MILKDKSLSMPHTPLYSTSPVQVQYISTFTEINARLCQPVQKCLLALTLTQVYTRKKWVGPMACSVSEEAHSTQ